MKFLIDTHYLLWALFAPDLISSAVKAELLNSSSIKYVSSISFWEISLKYSLGKLKLENANPEEIVSATEKSGFVIAEADSSLFASFWQLNRVEGHKDPFDRLLIWQCIKNDFSFISADKFAGQYKNQGLKLFEDSKNGKEPNLKETRAKFGAGSRKRSKTFSK